MFYKINGCRICGNRDLVSVLCLGEQYLTGVFPRVRDANITTGPLELVACQTKGHDSACGLVQLRHTFNLNEMYGDHYGYRSSLNKAMIAHLHEKVANLLLRVPLRAGDLVLDIGSNDGTLLSAYPATAATVVGVDPAAQKFASFYPPHIELVAGFFTAELFQERFGGRKARIITSIAMFYDLESPMEFMRNVASILADDGIWHFEQSYLPSMLRTKSYDTVCHEHIEYYSLKQIKWMADRCGLKIVDVEFNSVNGGSFAVTAAKAESAMAAKNDRIEEILSEEDAKGLADSVLCHEFEAEVHSHKEKLLALLRGLKAEGKTVLGYGASTKGNVLLQFCGITTDLLPCIAEVNSDKFGCFTPGTNIPIVSEKEAHALNPDYLLVLPWHFRDSLILRESEYLQRGGKMIFPLPSLEIYSAV